MTGDGGADRGRQARRACREPSDPSRFTSVKDPTEPFRFSFPDLDGKLVSNTDPRFQGKVVIVSIAGSWCPNCHDEAPFLVELYKKYRAAGARDRGAVVRGRSAAEESGAAARVHQALRHRLHRAAAGRAEGAERQGAAGREPQLVPDDVLPRPRRPGARRARRAFPARRAGKLHRRRKRSLRTSSNCWPSACTRPRRSSVSTAATIEH